MMPARALLTLALIWPLAAAAQDLPFAAPATVTDRVESPAGSLSLATGPWTPATGTPLRSFDGAIGQTAYRLAGSTLSTSELLNPLRDALIAQGYTALYECADTVCGGFDFRYDLPLLPEPAMHIDLGDYRYFAATKGVGQAVMLIVSRSANAGFVQVNTVGPTGTTPTPTLSTTSPSPPLPTPAPITRLATPATGDIGARLESGGSLALDDLVFPVGAATLAPGDYASLDQLAAYLAANPTRRIALVGHTDASGGLDANIALSRRRAESVRRVLTEQFNIPAAQVQAEGVGYLSPRASNLTDPGRAANRRVEVMLVNTE
jgi:outer membrane protein OmpA-like peptidoglycan-associated protein